MVGLASIIGFRKFLMTSLFVVILIGGLSGCVPEQRQPISHEPSRVKAQTRDYPGITAEQVLKASETIFQLADGRDMKITRGASVLEVKRSINSLVYKSSWEQWKVKTRQEGGATYVTVSAEFDKEGSKIYPRGVGAYRLFFSRLDYMLGASNDWMTCNQYESRLLQDPTWGYDDRFLCDHAKDSVPEGPLNRTDG